MPSKGRPIFLLYRSCCQTKKTLATYFNLIQTVFLCIFAMTALKLFFLKIILFISE